MDMLRSDRETRFAELPSTLSGRDRRAKIVLAASAFLVAVLSSFLAHSAGRPVTSALVFVFGVTLIGTMVGIKGGFVAGVLASILYNFLVGTSAFGHGISSIDDLVPLFAFNFSAVGSGLVAGLMRDRARAAEHARMRMQAVFEMSQSLQGAFDEADIVAAALPFLRSGPAGPVEIFLYDGRYLVPQTEPSSHSYFAQEVWAAEDREVSRGQSVGFLLGSARQRVGVLVARASRDSAIIDDLRGFVTVFSIALERCRLAKQLAEADLLRRSEEFKTALLSSVSHDLRTPLSAIAASATSLTRFGDSLEAATRLDLLATIQEQCDRLDRLTGNLLSIGRIQGGLALENMPVVDAIEMLGRVLTRVRLIGNGHRLDKRIAVEVAPVRAEAVMLEQIFYNILENAIVHTAAGTSILITATADEDWVRIIVEDSGGGIPEADLDRVFDRFVQGRRSRSARGAGLGLSIVKGFAEAAGGHVRASRADPPLGGACVEVCLPCAAARAA